MSDTANINRGYFDGYKLGKRQKMFLWIAAISYAYEFIDGGMFNFVTPVLINAWGIPMEKIATLNSLFFIGMFLGGIFSGWVAQKWGRKFGLLASIACFSIGSLLTAFAQPSHILTLEISRLLTGIGVAGQVVVGMVYITEMMPSEGRGKYMALTVAGGTIFVPLSTLLFKWILAFGGESWRWMFGIGASSLILIPIGIIVLRESPRWLVVKGEVAKAEKIVEECVGVKTDLSGHVSAHSKGIGMLKTVQLMFGPTQFKRTMVALILCWGILIGNMFLMNWIAALLNGLGIPLATIMTVFAVAGWGTPIGDYVCSFFTDKGGRKTPIFVFCLITGACYVGMGIVGGSAVGFALFYFTRCVFGNGASTMMWNYVTELFPNSIRSSATGLLQGFGRLAVAGLMLVVPLLLNSIGYLGLSVINGLFFIIPGFIVLLMGDKTAKVSLEGLENAVVPANPAGP